MVLESSRSGRAWVLDERVIFRARDHGFDTLAAGYDMFSIAERFVEKQMELKVTGKPTHVDIRYHNNTQPEYLPCINERWDLSCQEMRRIFALAVAYTLPIIHTHFAILVTEDS